MAKLIKTPILITGSIGLIGANLTHHLISERLNPFDHKKYIRYLEIK